MGPRRRRARRRPERRVRSAARRLRLEDRPDPAPGRAARRSTPRRRQRDRRDDVDRVQRRLLRALAARLRDLGPGPAWWGEVVLVLGALTRADRDPLRGRAGRDRAASSASRASSTAASSCSASASLCSASRSHRPELAAAGLLAATLHLLMHGDREDARAPRCSGTRERATGAGTCARSAGSRRSSRAPLSPSGSRFSASPRCRRSAASSASGSRSRRSCRASGSTRRLARLIMALAAAILALTAGIGLLAFAKLYGGIFLGRARTASRPAARAARPAVGVLCSPTLASRARCGRAVGDPLARSRTPRRARLRPRRARRSDSRSCSAPSTQHFSVLAPTWLALGIATFVVTAAAARAGAPPPAGAPRPGLALRAPHPSVAVRPVHAGRLANPIRVVLSSAATASSGTLDDR